jgi:hypothetical protein
LQHNLATSCRSSLRECACILVFTTSPARVSTLLLAFTTAHTLVNSSSLALTPPAPPHKHTQVGSEEPFASLAAAVNDSISSGYLDDTLFGTHLLLATDFSGADGDAQPDVWGSGLAVHIGAGTDSQVSFALAFAFAFAFEITGYTRP